MSKIAARNFKGTRDFTPDEMIPRELLIEKMKQVFRLHGFNPLETPALEKLEVLSGKYGDEGEKLLYKLDYKNDRPKDRVALRYDLTVPLARVVASHPEWSMPFKRYQVQPVWRADQPQIRQGRFREFYQCDVDTIGAVEGLADAEIISLTVKMIETLGFTGKGKQAIVLVNHRKILEALCEFAGKPVEELASFCRILDKMDKIGKDAVYNELKNIGVKDNGLNNLDRVFCLEGTITDKLDNLEKLLSPSDSLTSGIEGLRTIFNALAAMKINMSSLRFEPRLARGLDYYTGAVFETIIPEQPHIGSLTGGGRYDKLIGLYSGQDLPAVGTTIGLDRMFAAMNQLKMLNLDQSTVTRVLIAAYSNDEINTALGIVDLFRKALIPAELFPTTGKMKKPFNYANKMNIPFVGVVGPDEIADPDNIKVALKTLAQGTQEILTVKKAIETIKTGLILQ